MRPEIIPGLRRLTDAIHAEGAAAGIQLGHCGNMSHKSICGCMPVGASSGFNLYSPTFVRGLRADELPEMARAYGRSVNLAREAGFDSVAVSYTHLDVYKRQIWYLVHKMRLIRNSTRTGRPVVAVIWNMHTARMAVWQF